jgi:hypothetical protein
MFNRTNKQYVALGKIELSKLKVRISQSWSGQSPLVLVQSPCSTPFLGYVVMFLASINPSSDKSTVLLQKKKVSITKSVVKKQHKHHIFKFQCQVYGEHHILGESW